MRNMKLDWNSILDGQIQWLENLYKNDEIRSSYNTIIPLLTDNKIPSRIIISGGKVLAYSYYIKGNEEDDRLYSTMGFQSKTIDDNKITSLLDWLISASKKENKIIIMNGVFNEPDNFKELISKKDFNVINRIRMELDLSNQVVDDYKENTKFKLTKIHKENLQEVCELLYDSFRSLPERFLLPAGNNKANLLAKGLLEGTFGKFLDEISYLASDANDDIIGGMVFTDGSTEFKHIPLLLFIFILSDFRGQGLSEEIICGVLNKIKKSGIREIQLWVDKNNFAYNIYKKLGFKQCENEKTPIYCFNP